jgi:hypothetical protein
VSPDGASAGRGASARLALLASLLLAAALFLPFRGYLTDDTFIHLQFAKHVSRGDGFAFNRDQPTYGATSPLWVGLLAASGRAGVPVSAPGDAQSMPPLAIAAKVLGGAFALAAVWLLVATAGRLGWEPRAVQVAGGMLALNAWSARWALSGMETPLAVACVALSLYLLARVLPGGRGALLLGVALGMGGLARPELHLFAWLTLGCVLLGARSRGGRAALAAAGGYGALTVPWFAACWVWFHRLLPNTAAAKAGAWLDPGRALGALKASAEILLATDALPLALLLAGLALGAAANAGRDRPRRAFFLLMAVWPPALILALAAAGTQVVSRYLLPALPCVLLLGVASLRRLVGRLRPGRIGLGYAAALLLYAAPNLYLTARVTLPSAVAHTAGLRDSLVRIGLWARGHTRPEDEFAVPDIGAFGYYSDRRVLDLFGLVTPRMAPIVVRAGYDAVVRDFLFEGIGRPSYLIDRGREADRLGRSAGEPSPYEFLFARMIPNLGVTRPTPYVYSVYRIDWEAYDETHPRAAVRWLEPPEDLDYTWRNARSRAGRGGQNQLFFKRLP